MNHLVVDYEKLLKHINEDDNLYDQIAAFFKNNNPAEVVEVIKVLCELDQKIENRFDWEVFDYRSQSHPTLRFKLSYTNLDDHSKNWHYFYSSISFAKLAAEIDFKDRKKVHIVWDNNLIFHDLEHIYYICEVDPVTK